MYLFDLFEKMMNTLVTVAGALAFAYLMIILFAV